MDLEALIAFLAELKANNHKTWFDENRPRYEALRAAFYAELQKIIDGFAEYDPALLVLKPKDTAFRINKRFPDAEGPYKPHFSAQFTGIGHGPGNTGYYFEIPSSGVIGVGGGWYQPAPIHLNWILTDIAAHPQKLTHILEEPEFKRVFGELGDYRSKKMPKGFPADHPYAELLKQRSFVVWQDRDAAALDGTLIEHVTARFKLMTPMIKYLRTLEESAPEIEKKEKK